MTIKHWDSVIVYIKVISASTRGEFCIATTSLGCRNDGHDPHDGFITFYLSLVKSYDLSRYTSILCFATNRGVHNITWIDYSVKPSFGALWLLAMYMSYTQSETTLWQFNIAIEHGHSYFMSSWIAWWFCTAMLVITRGYIHYYPSIYPLSTTILVTHYISTIDHY